MYIHTHTRARARTHTKSLCLHHRMCARPSLWVLLLLCTNFVCKACLYGCVKECVFWMIEAVEWSKFTRKSSSNTETNRKRTEKRTAPDEKRKRAPSNFESERATVVDEMWMCVYRKYVSVFGVTYKGNEFQRCHKQIRTLAVALNGNVNLYNLNIFWQLYHQTLYIHCATVALRTLQTFNWKWAKYSKLTQTSNVYCSSLQLTSKLVITNVQSVHTVHVRMAKIYDLNIVYIWMPRDLAYSHCDGFRAAKMHQTHYLVLIFRLHCMDSQSPFSSWFGIWLAYKFDIWLQWFGAILSYDY